MRATAFNQQVAQIARHLRQKRVCDVLGDLGDGLGAGGRRVRQCQRRLGRLSAFGIKVFPAAILGGLDSVGGAVLGGIIIGLLENFAQFLDSEYLHWGNLYEIAPFYALIIILMIKPYGLFGTKDIERV